MVNVRRWESVEEFATECKGITPKASFGPSTAEALRTGNYTWMGGLGWKETLTRAITGDEALASKATAMMQKIEELEAEVTSTSWQPSVAGAYPVVPEFLAGMPDCMRIRRPTISDMAPLNVYVGVGCSSQFTAEEMQTRGIVILALVLKLQQVRPIQLYVINIEEEGGNVDAQILRVQSQPLAVGTACFAIGSVAFTRWLLFQEKHRHGVDGNWSPGVAENIVRQVVGMEKEDLFIPNAYALDRQLTNDPLGWVNDKIKKYGRVEEI